MQSRKDQVQAYFFVVGRLFSALTHGKPDILEPPTRRFSMGTTFGVLLAALLVGIFWIVGLYAPATSTDWQRPGTIIVDKSSGARFLYLDGRLRPVLNFSSAKLAAAGSGSGSGGAVELFSAKSLSGVPVGVPIGIPGAPDAIPPADGIDKGPWTVCVAVSGAPRPVTLLLGSTAGQPVTAGQAILVSGPDGARQLLWQGRRYRFGAFVAGALGYSAAGAIPVPANWLNSIPVGRDIAMPKIAQLGSAGPVIDGRTTVVGQILRARNPALNSEQHFVVVENGIKPLTTTVEALLLASPDTRQAYGGGNVAPIEVDPGALTGVPTIGNEDYAGYPPAPPMLLNTALSDGAVPCVRSDPSGGKSGFVLMAAAEVNAKAAPSGRHVAGSTVDQVSIPAGSGVLARDLPAPGAIAGTEYLVTDVGIKFPLADPSVAGALGYSGGSAVEVASRFLALLPTGPVLSRASALAEGTP
ncbi:type VII secretion protein EccB [Amycolatopsis sp. NPDC049868]|uniref:type VII secretion protein EccB n=1 Tax=Amycolatopsis sp. NPDC049868 TaxID=3363934 RepID=UPI00378DA6B6